MMKYPLRIMVARSCRSRRHCRGEAAGILGMRASAALSRRRHRAKLRIILFDLRGSVKM